MQRTSEYRVGRPPGDDPSGAVAWLGRQQGWERRLRALEGVAVGPDLRRRAVPRREPVRQ